MFQRDYYSDEERGWLQPHRGYYSDEEEVEEVEEVVEVSASEGEGDTDARTQDMSHTQDVSHREDTLAKQDMSRRKDTSPKQDTSHRKDTSRREETSPKQDTSHGKNMSDRQDTSPKQDMSHKEDISQRNMSHREDISPKQDRSPCVTQQETASRSDVTDADPGSSNTEKRPRNYRQRQESLGSDDSDPDRGGVAAVTKSEATAVTADSTDSRTDRRPGQSESDLCTDRDTIPGDSADSVVSSSVPELEAQGDGQKAEIEGTERGQADSHRHNDRQSDTGKDKDTDGPVSATDRNISTAPSKASGSKSGFQSKASVDHGYEDAAKADNSGTVPVTVAGSRAVEVPESQIREPIPTDPDTDRVTDPDRKADTGHQARADPGCADQDRDSDSSGRGINSQEDNSDLEDGEIEDSDHSQPDLDQSEETSKRKKKKKVIKKLIIRRVVRDIDGRKCRTVEERVVGERDWGPHDDLGHHGNSGDSAGHRGNNRGTSCIEDNSAQGREPETIAEPSRYGENNQPSSSGTGVIQPKSAGTGQTPSTGNSSSVAQSSRTSVSRAECIQEADPEPIQVAEPEKAPPTYNEMEIRELEMRARAIKAMLKAQEAFEKHQQNLAEDKKKEKEAEMVRLQAKQRQAEIKQAKIEQEQQATDKLKQRQQTMEKLKEKQAKIERLRLKYLGMERSKQQQAILAKLQEKQLILEKLKLKQARLEEQRLKQILEEKTQQKPTEKEDNPPKTTATEQKQKQPRTSTQDSVSAAASKVKSLPASRKSRPSGGGGSPAAGKSEGKTSTERDSSRGRHRSSTATGRSGPEETAVKPASTSSDADRKKMSESATSSSDRRKSGKPSGRHDTGKASKPIKLRGRMYSDDIQAQVQWSAKAAAATRSESHQTTSKLRSEIGSHASGSHASGSRASSSHGSSSRDSRKLHKESSSHGDHKKARTPQSTVHDPRKDQDAPRKGSGAIAVQSGDEKHTVAKSSVTKSGQGATTSESGLVKILPQKAKTEVKEVRRIRIKRTGPLSTD